MTKFKYVAIVALTGISLALGIGCNKREHSKVTVIEEQREGEVKEVKPGEMVVE